MSTCMPYDDVAWVRSDETTNKWLQKLCTLESYGAIGDFVKEHRGGVVREVYPPTRGGLNVHFRVRFADGESAIMRFPDPGRVPFPDEKVRKEVAIMQMVRDRTTIPVPRIIHYGMTDESPLGLGPFILMEYIEHAGDLNDALNTPRVNVGERPILNPRIRPQRLELAYGQIADILLQLSQLSFARIGSPSNVYGDSWSVTERPLTMNMTELVQLGNFPPSKLPQGTVDTAASYFSAMAQIHLTHLATQRNDAVESAEDCRRKYIARHLFIERVKQSQLSDPLLTASPSKLFCDDLCPSNFLVNADLKVVAVIDWEFTYAAPAEFTYSPPFWLLLERPEYWPGGLSDWAATYEPRLQTFLRVLEDKEQKAVRDGNLDPADRLSGRMRACWECGDFWVNYALQRSWAFDGIYWKWIDSRSWGAEMTVEQRLELLPAEVREGIDEFVQKKLEERKTRVLHDWSATEGKKKRYKWT